MNELINKHQGKIIVVTVLLVIVSAWGNFNTDLWHWIDAIVTIGTVIGVWYNYKENQKQLEPIQIHLSTQTKPLSSFVLRKNFTRAEVKGILRELAEEKDYEIDYISNPKSSFLRDVYNVQTSKTDNLTVMIKEKDIFTLKENV